MAQNFDVVVIGAGGATYDSVKNDNAGSGGGLAYKNNIAVTPGQTLYYQVGSGNNADGGQSGYSMVSWTTAIGSSTDYIYAGSGGARSTRTKGQAGYPGGSGLGVGHFSSATTYIGGYSGPSTAVSASVWLSDTGGGGAAGFAGNGGNGGWVTKDDGGAYLTTNSATAGSGTNGGGGGGDGGAEHDDARPLRTGAGHPGLHGRCPVLLHRPVAGGVPRVRCSSECGLPADLRRCVAGAVPDVAGERAAARPLGSPAHHGGECDRAVSRWRGRGGGGSGRAPRPPRRDENDAEEESF